MLKTIYIKKNERGILLERGDFVRILESGTYRFLNPFNKLEVKKFAVDSEFTDAAMLNYLHKNEPDLLARYFHNMELTDQEAGLLYANKQLVEILVPGTRQCVLERRCRLPVGKSGLCRRSSGGFQTGATLTAVLDQRP